MSESDPPIARHMQDPPPGKPVEEEEVVYFEGRPVLRAEQAKAAMFLIIGLILLALPILAEAFDWTRWDHRWMTPVAILLAIIAVLAPWLIVRTTRYRITNYRIDYERGVLKKRIDTMELWHVDDISFEQGFVDRLMNVGSIKILSDDRTTPRLDLDGLPNPRAIFDQLRQRVITVKRHRGVIKMDMG
ncbi:MAG TPA: PH domain-containing protein [Tepidisphaeraceae bacterium]|nr:PH domain-containing protein [Tepidisphaeraceae bacterium]